MKEEGEISDSISVCSMIIPCQRDRETEREREREGGSVCVGGGGGIEEVGEKESLSIYKVYVASVLCKNENCYGNQVIVVYRHR